MFNKESFETKLREVSLRVQQWWKPFLTWKGGLLRRNTIH